jgi:exopolyphosphatase/guanosine-5'-triphosphate,3'-diphosphate pyrophosphatase
MLKKFAIFDLGSGSVKSLIVETDEKGDFKIIESERVEPCPPGKGLLDVSEMVLEEALSKNIETLKYFLKKARRHGADEVHIISTEALRKAKNKDEVIAKISQVTGITPLIISQQREAELFWKGVTADFPEDMEVAAVDIGGGSIQFMYGTKNILHGHKLLSTGVFRLKEKFQTSDPFSEEGISRVEGAIRDEIQDLDVLFSPETPYIHGASAVIDFYQAIGLPMDTFKHSQSHPFKVNLDLTRRFYEKSQKMTETQRLKLSPNLPGFASAAVIGLANVLLLAEKTGLKYELPSNYNITHGIVRAIIEGKL